MHLGQLQGSEMPCEVHCFIPALMCALHQPNGPARCSDSCCPPTAHALPRLFTLLAHVDGVRGCVRALRCISSNLLKPYEDALVTTCLEMKAELREVR